MPGAIRFLPVVLISIPVPGQTNNPFNTPAEVEKGAAVFQVHCSYCHGPHGEGGRGADLTTGQYRQGGSDQELFYTIKYGVRGSEMPSTRTADEDIWRMVAFVKKIGSAGADEIPAGDPKNGRLIYAKRGCVSCHAIGTEGGNLGPDLTDIGRRRGLNYLQQSIVKPDADVPMNYRAVVITTRTGRKISGIRLNEDDLSVQL